MNWADTVKAYSSLTSSQRYSGDASVIGGASPASWDPHEVWVTRIKEPRERAARIVTLGTSSSATGAGELVPAR
jgi:hypothetical protein